MKKKILKLFFGAAVLWMVAQGAQQVQAAESVKTADEAVTYLKEKVSAKESSITVTVSKSTYDTYGADGLLDKAVKHTEDSKGYEGDAILYDGGYSAKMNVSSSATEAVITYNMTYELTKEQETQIRTAVTKALSDLNLTGKTDLEKVRLIYDYICDNVDYDYGVTYGELSYTSYSAITNKKAVCQGYATLFYRMCKEAGLDVRIVAGTGDGEAHAWNIVKIGDEYFNVDCTWDGQDTATNHNYFLKNEADFTKHEREEAFTTTEFMKAYPMADTSYFDYVELGTKWDLNNVETMNLTTINDGTVTNKADGKAKLLVFYSTKSTSVQTDLAAIAKSGYADADIVAIEVDEDVVKSDIQTYAKTVGGSNITFCYDATSASNSLLWKYLGLKNWDGILPLSVYVDEANKVQYMNIGVEVAGTIEERFDLFKNGIVSLSSAKESIATGKSKTLTVKVDGEERNPLFFTWTSSNSKVATADKNGTVTAVSNGTAVITCSVGEVIKLQATIEVTESEKDNAEDTKDNTEDTKDNTEDTKEDQTVNKLEGLAKASDGNWYYYKDSKIDTSYNGLVKYNNTWWYVVKGKLDFSYRGLCKHNGSWWYIKDGKLDFGYTGLCKHNGSWWYIKDGKLDFGYTGLCKYSGSWWYIKGGKLDFGYTGLCKYSGSWWYIKGGKLDFGYTGLCKYSGSWWYVKGGKLNFGYTGLCKYNGSWWYVKSGKLNFSYTGLVWHGSNWWYVRGGKLDFNYTGTVKYAGCSWKVKKGIMTGRV